MVFSTVTVCDTDTDKTAVPALIGNTHSCITTIIALVTSVYRSWCAILPLGGAAVHKNITHHAHPANVYRSH